IGRVRIADGEVLNGLLFSVLVDFEVVLRELADELAASVVDGDADVNEVHGASEYRHLLRRHEGHGGSKGHRGDTCRKERAACCFPHRSHSTPAHNRWLVHHRQKAQGTMGVDLLTKPHGTNPPPLHVTTVLNSSVTP